MDNLFSIIFQHLPNPTLVIADDRTIEYANVAANSAFDSLLPGKDLALSLRHPDVLNAVARTLANGTSEQGEFTIPGPLTQVFEFHTVPLADPLLQADAHSHVLLSMLDKTKIARSEEMRADFVANASHELRSPLSAILGFIETLQGPASNDEQARIRFLGIMDREAKRMNRLIDDLLRLSRVEIDEHVRPRGQVDVVACIRNVFELLEPRAKAKQIKLALDVADPPAPINGDTDQLNQVFRNLIENAIHYGDEGSTVQVTVEKRAHQTNIPESGVAVHVQDHGKGIAKQHIPRLTERFYRIDDSRTRHTSNAPISTGLGLAIVKHIVNRHRGRLKIESELDKGSTFSVLLPTE